MTLTIEKTRAYGLYRAAGVRPDGGQVEALGVTPEAAAGFAAVRARDWERCDGCSRVVLRPGEAKVSRRAFRGLALCPCCQNTTSDPSKDLEREARAGL